MSAGLLRAFRSSLLVSAILLRSKLMTIFIGQSEGVLIEAFVKVRIYSSLELSKSFLRTRIINCIP